MVTGLLRNAALLVRDSATRADVGTAIRLGAGHPGVAAGFVEAVARSGRLVRVGGPQFRLRGAAARLARHELRPRHRLRRGLPEEAATVLAACR